MYQAETPSGLCKYKDNEKGKPDVSRLTESTCNTVVIKSLKARADV